MAESCERGVWVVGHLSRLFIMATHHGYSSRLFIEAGRSAASVRQMRSSAFPKSKVFHESSASHQRVISESSMSHQ